MESKAAGAADRRRKDGASLPYGNSSKWRSFDGQVARWATVDDPSTMTVTPMRSWLRSLRASDDELERKQSVEEAASKLRQTKGLNTITREELGRLGAAAGPEQDELDAYEASVARRKPGSRTTSVSNCSYCALCRYLCPSRCPYC